MTEGVFSVLNGAKLNFYFYILKYIHLKTKRLTFINFKKYALSMHFFFV